MNMIATDETLLEAPVLTALQAALIGLGFKTLEFKNGDIANHRQVADSPDASIIHVLRYGKRAYNDSVNSSPDKVKARTDWMKKFDSGLWGTMIQIQSPFDKALDEQTVLLLRQMGMKAKDAKDLLKTENIGLVLFQVVGLAENQIKATVDHCEMIAAMQTGFTIPAPDLTTI